MCDIHFKITGEPCNLALSRVNDLFTRWPRQGGPEPNSGLTGFFYPSFFHSQFNPYYPKIQP